MASGGLFWIFFGFVTLLSFSAVYGVWTASTGVTLGAVVSVGGSAIGIGGAAFGMQMAHQRARITRFLDHAAEV